MKKRTFLKTSAVGFAGTFIATCIPKNSFGKSFLKKENYPAFTILDLTYSYNALEPFMDARSLKIHYQKHHEEYTVNFNTAVRKAGIKGKKAIQIVREISYYGDSVRFYGGGFINHRLFWKILSPNGGGQPKVDLLKAINNDFGSFDKFKQEFSQKANSHIGQGWIFLVKSGNTLKITETSENNSPIMDDADVKGRPLLLLDLWEHSYYPKYRNNRKEYIDKFWDVVNWNFVSDRYKRFLRKD